MSTPGPAPKMQLASTGQVEPEDIPRTKPKKSLTLFDAACIIVGIIIGAGIFETAPTVAACMRNGTATFAVWLAGGLLALTGALSYAELATAYPRQGGDYIYQTRAFGRGTGYLFGWSQLMIIRPGDIALLAFVFARYARTIFDPIENGLRLYAGAAVVILTGINVLGVRGGMWTQNLLTVLKSAGLLAIVGVALLAPTPALAPQGMAGSLPGGLELALILVLFTYGGWNEIAYVAAEIRNPKRNIVRGLVIGTATVTVLYLLVNGAFLRALGYEGMVASEAVATDTAATVFPGAASRVIGVLVCISALGAINGMIFTGSRISYAMGTEHTLFRWLGRWNPRLGTPVWALVAQGLLSLLIILVAGSFINTILYTAPIVWIFFLVTGLSVFVLRRREPDTPRPYRVLPVMPAIFCACCVFMLYSCVSYALNNKPLALAMLAGFLLTGAVTYVLSLFACTKTG